MTLSFYATLVLGAVAPSWGQSPHSASSSSEAPLTIDELSRVDVRGTAQSIALIARQIHDLDPQARAQAADSLRILSVSDPYTRSAMQLPIALHRVVQGIPAESLEPLVQKDWLTLQEGLTTHVAVLDALGVDLPMPGPGDPLHGHEDLLVDRGTLLTMDDPILATSLLIHELTSLAEQVAPPTSERIERHSDRVEEATGIGRPCPRGPHAVLPGQPWTLGMQLGGWHDALRRVEPFVTEPSAQAQVAAMVKVLDAHGEAGFASATR